MSQTESSYTPQDLLTMPGGDRYELVAGDLVEKIMGWEASLVATIIVGLIRPFDPEYKHGHVVAEGSYQCFPADPSKVRRPDVSFVGRDKLAGREYPKGHSEIVPDLIVEVVSPHDKFEDVENRITEHFEAGVGLAWIVNPATRTVLVFHADRSESSRLRGSDELDGEQILPGFKC